jgi:hypothetical protein
MDYSKLPYYALFLFLFVLAQSFSMWGQFVTLPYKSLSMWEAYKMAIPFAWVDWIIMTFTVMVGHEHDLVTPTQDTFLLIIIQFCLILLINQYYLKEKVYRSDIIAFFIILIGFFISFLHLVSKAFGIPIPEHLGHDNPDEASATTKSLRYRISAKSSGDLEYSTINDNDNPESEEK